MTPALRSAAAALLRERRERDAVFGAYRDGFGEPAWEILLVLAAGEDRNVLPQDVMAGVHATAETADIYLRWAMSQDLVVRDGDHVRMSERAAALMTIYLAPLTNSTGDQ